MRWFLASAAAPFLLFQTMGCSQASDIVLPSVGQLAISVTATDSDYPAAPLLLRIDGVDHPLSLPNYVATFTVDTGSHTVSLRGLATGCEAGDTIRTVHVTGSAASPVTFNVACSGRYGTLSLTTVTTGADPDVDGYSVQFGNLPVRDIASNGTLLLGRVLVGTYARPALSGVNGNCGWSSPTGATLVSVGPHEAASVTLVIACHATIRGRIVFYSDRDGSGGIWSVLPDGSGLQKVHSTSEAIQFALSPDGARIVTTTLGQVRLYFLDGTVERTLVATNDCWPYHPRWTPDGQTILFASCSSLMSVRPDGTDLHRILSAGDADVSPDGLTLLYRTTSSGLMFALPMSNLQSGTATNLGWYGNVPRWSPSGTRVAYVLFHGGPGLATIDPNGQNMLRLTTFSSGAPSWSPDGTRLAFGSDNDIWIVNADGSGLAVLVGGGSIEASPQWSRP